MTARRATLALALTLAACGAEKSPAPVFRVTIGSATYPAADSAGFLMPPMACSQLGEGSHTMVQVRLSTAGGLCSLAKDHAFCAEKAGAVTALLAIVRANLNGGLVPAIVPGTYASADHGMVGADGTLMWFWASRDGHDASCGPLLGGPKEGGLGTITFDEVGPTRIRGSADIAFDDGSALSGPFDVAVCAAPGAELCASLKGGCSSVTCVP